MSRRRGKAATVHDGASTPASDEERAELTRLFAKHEVPGRCTTPPVTGNTLAMADRVIALIAGEPGISYEARKLADWIRHLPTKAQAAAGGIPDPAWPSWNSVKLAIIADTVLIDGQPVEAVAHRHGTTPATVDAIVRAERARLHTHGGRS